MASTSAVRDIEAPVNVVFSAITDVEKFTEKSPDIVRIEVLSDVRSGVGLRFRETRKVRGRESSTELRLTEYIENSRARFVADQGGVIWDTVFTVEPAGSGARLGLVMEARPHSFAARLTTPFIMGMVGKVVEHDMDAVKAYCESVA